MYRSRFRGRRSYGYGPRRSYGMRRRGYGRSSYRRRSYGYSTGRRYGGRSYGYRRRSYGGNRTLRRSSSYGAYRRYGQMGARRGRSRYVIGGRRY